jgi:hypothetical protein
MMRTIQPKRRHMMSRVILAIVTAAFLCTLVACAGSKEPPAVIYPNPKETPHNYNQLNR